MTQNILKRSRSLGKAAIFAFAINTFLFCAGELIANHNSVSVQEKNIQTLKNFFDESYHSQSLNEKQIHFIVEKYFRKDYVQYVDGKTMHYQHVLPHRMAQLKAVKDVQVTFEHLMAEKAIKFSVFTTYGLLRKVMEKPLK